MFAKCDECGHWREGVSFDWKAAKLSGMQNAHRSTIKPGYIGTTTIQTHRCSECWGASQREANLGNARASFSVGLLGMVLVAIVIVYDVVSDAGLVGGLSVLVLAPIVLALLGLGLWAFFMNLEADHGAMTRADQRELAQAKADLLGLSVFSPKEYAQLLRENR